MKAYRNIRIFNLLIILHLIRGISGVFYSVSIGKDLLFILTWFFIGVNFEMIAKAFKETNLKWSGALLIIIGLFTSTIFNGISIFASFSYLNYLSIAILIITVIETHIESLIKSLSFVIIFHLVVAVLELLRGKTFYYSTWKNANATSIGSFIRVASTIGDPNYLALSLIILAISVRHLLTVTGISKSIYRRISNFALFAVLFTFSRAGILALLVIIMGRVLRRFRSAGFLLLLFSGGSLVLPLLGFLIPRMPFIEVYLTRFTSLLSGDASALSRLQLQTFGLKEIFQNPIFGVGPDRFQLLSSSLFSVSRPFNLQTEVLNTFMEFYLVGGIFAFIGFLILLFSNRINNQFLHRVPTYDLLALIIILSTLDTFKFPYLWVILPILSVSTRKSK